MLFANSDNDPIFPMDANRRIIAKLRKIYKMYGKPELVDEYVSKGGHAYRPDLRIAIFKWINQHSKNDTTTPVEDTQFAELPGMLLRVFRADADIPTDAINAKIDETFVPVAKVELPEKGKFAEWKIEKMKEIRHCFRNIPKKIAPAKYKGGGQLVASMETEPGITVGSGTDAIYAGKVRSWVIFNNSEDLKAKWFEEWVGRGYFGLFTRGGWAKKSPPNYVERAHALLGRTVDEGRLLDLLSHLQLLRKSALKAPKVIGQGQAGILAAYAALFEPSIKEVVIIDPPTSHKEGPIFLNVLRVLDIPEALGLLAPNVKLTLINAKDRAFDRTEQIYKLAGAADKLVRK